MADQRRDNVLAHLARSRAAFERAVGDPAFVTAVTAIAGCIADALRAGRKVMLAGNGGSAADAQHAAAELVGRFGRDRAPLAAVALTTDTSALTAIANDYGFERVFERQLRALAQDGDVFVGITTSGSSPNVVAALKAAREIGIAAIGFTGLNGAGLRTLCDHVLVAPTDVTAHIQELHIAAFHAICGTVEHELFGTATPG